MSYPDNPSRYPYLLLCPLYVLPRQSKSISISIVVPTVCLTQTIQVDIHIYCCVHCMSYPDNPSRYPYLLLCPLHVLPRQSKSISISIVVSTVCLTQTIQVDIHIYCCAHCMSYPDNPSRYPYLLLCPLYVLPRQSKSISISIVVPTVCLTQTIQVDIHIYCCVHCMPYPDNPSRYPYLLLCPRYVLPRQSKSISISIVVPTVCLTQTIQVDIHIYSCAHCMSYPDNPSRYPYLLLCPLYVLPRQSKSIPISIVVPTVCLTQTIQVDIHIYCCVHGMSYPDNPSRYPYLLLCPRYVLPRQSKSISISIVVSTVCLTQTIQVDIHIYSCAHCMSYPDNPSRYPYLLLCPLYVLPRQSKSISISIVVSTVCLTQTIQVDIHIYSCAHCMSYPDNPSRYPYLLLCPRYVLPRQSKSISISIVVPTVCLTQTIQVDIHIYCCVHCMSYPDNPSRYPYLLLCPRYVLPRQSKSISISIVVPTVCLTQTIQVDIHIYCCVHGMSYPDNPSRYPYLLLCPRYVLPRQSKSISISIVVSTVCLTQTIQVDIHIYCCAHCMSYPDNPSRYPYLLLCPMYVLPRQSKSISISIVVPTVCLTQTIQVDIHIYYCAHCMSYPDNPSRYPYLLLCPLYVLPRQSKSISISIVVPTVCLTQTIQVDIHIYCCAHCMSYPDNPSRYPYLLLCPLYVLPRQSKSISISIVVSTVCLTQTIQVDIHIYCCALCMSYPDNPSRYPYLLLCPLYVLPRQSKSISISIVVSTVCLTQTIQVDIHIYCCALCMSYPDNPSRYPYLLLCPLYVLPRQSKSISISIVVPTVCLTQTIQVDIHIYCCVHGMSYPDNPSRYPYL